MDTPQCRHVAVSMPHPTSGHERARRPAGAISPAKPLVAFSAVDTANVPLITPGTSQLRADAVWITIANWADALAARYGSSTIVTPTERLTGTEARRSVWTAGRTSSAPANAARARHHRILAKDARSLARGLRFRWSLDTPWGAPTPYVWQHHDLFQTAGFRLADTTGCPLVLFVDAPQIWESERWGVRRPLWGRCAERVGESWQFGRADVVACVSQEVADAVLERGASERRVIITPCSADPERYQRAESRRDELDLRGRLVVGWVGSFRPFHNAEVLVRAVADATDGRDDVALLMVGDGPTRSSCEALAHDLGVTARFVGSVPNEEVPDYLATMTSAPSSASPGAISTTPR